MTQILPHDELKLILSEAHGRKVIGAVLGQLGLFRQPYVVGDPTTTAYNCGALNFALAFFNECQVATPEMTAIMIRELSNVGPSTDEPRKQPGKNYLARDLNELLDGVDDAGAGPFLLPD